MTENERISKWRGECRPHRWVWKGEYFKRCTKCQKVVANWNTKTIYIKYGSEPSAWTHELYQAIEDAGLHMEFVRFLRYQVANYINDSTIVYWRFAKATPAQNATALSRAIQEAE